MRAFVVLLAMCALGMELVGCKKSSTQPGADGAAQGSHLTSSGSGPKYVVLGTRTDETDMDKAKSQAEDTITKFPDLGCMVGLFAYNPPKCLDALREAGKLDKVRVVGFDEDKDTLQGIQDGGVYGTVVQNPYRYGYESVRILAGLIKGDKSVLPKDNYLDIPARKITQANVAEFRQELDKLMAPSRETAADSPDRPTVAFVTNCIASFWVIGEKGARDAAKEFNVNLKMIMPPSGTVEEQTRMVEDALTKGVAGVAISPINPDNQTDLLNQIAEKAILITHDSDAPNSKRLCYVGMDNYQAGHMCGELVRDAMPNGGSSMLFVGRLEQLNAKLRNEGTIDAILGRERQTGAAIP